VISTLTTDRLILRPPDLADAGAIAAALDDWEVVRWLSVVPFPYRRADAEWFIGEISAGREVSRAIYDCDGPCGMIGVTGTGLGYWLAQRVWGRGFATEAGRAVVAEHFAAADAPDLRSGYFADNARSGHVLRKLGFVEMGPKTLPSRALGREVASVDMVLTRAAWERANG